MNKHGRLVNWYPVPEGDDEKGHNAERDYVAFDTMCELTHTPCAELRVTHGHLRLSDDDGLVAMVPFPCASQEGIQRLLDILVEQRKVSVVAREVFRTMSEVQQMPVAMTDYERKIFNDERQVRFFTHYGYHS